jgi:hypothetical protein
VTPDQKQHCAATIARLLTETEGVLRQCQFALKHPDTVVHLSDGKVDPVRQLLRESQDLLSWLTQRQY